jgi:hypothetical protein
LQESRTFLSREEVTKYFEVRFFSLALMAIGFFVVCVFLLFFFTSRGQYIYSVLVVTLMIIALVGAVELTRYAKILKRREKDRLQKMQIANNHPSFEGICLFRRTCYDRNDCSYSEERESKTPTR